LRVSNFMDKRRPRVTLRALFQAEHSPKRASDIPKYSQIIAFYCWNNKLWAAVILYILSYLAII
jgi:hypothetical protein